MCFHCPFGVNVAVLGRKISWIHWVFNIPTKHPAWKNNRTGPFFSDIWYFLEPIESMYGLFTCMYHRNQANVGKYTIHGWYGKSIWCFVEFTVIVTVLNVFSLLFSPILNYWGWDCFVNRVSEKKTSPAWLLWSPEIKSWHWIQKKVDPTTPLFLHLCKVSFYFAPWDSSYETTIWDMWDNIFGTFFSSILCKSKCSIFLHILIYEFRSS